DGRGRHGEYIHSLPQALEPLLVLDTEALLLVDDDQAEVLELHIRTNQPVGADNDVDAALAQALDDAFLFAGRAKTADALDDKRIVSHALREGAKVLFGEHSGRHQHRDLPAIIDDLEGGADGQFSLAVTDIAADEPIHRPSTLQIALELGEG